jgi:hypothetical protein
MDNATVHSEDAGLELFAAPDSSGEHQVIDISTLALTWKSVPEAIP